VCRFGADPRADRDAARERERHRHVERASIEMPHGTSGGPVFFEGNIVGVNSRAWDFAGGEHAGQHLSSVVPIQYALPIKVNGELIIPRGSWERDRLSVTGKLSQATLAEWVQLGLVHATE